MLATESRRWLRIVTGVVALALASPLDLLWLGPFSDSGPISHLAGGVSLAIMLATSAVGVAGLRWALRSWSSAALVASLANLPLAINFGAQESGVWASMLGIPKYVLFGIVGWVGWRRPGNSTLRWAGAMVPTALAALPLAVELAAGMFARNP